MSGFGAAGVFGSSAAEREKFARESIARDAARALGTFTLPGGDPLTRARGAATAIYTSTSALSDSLRSVDQYSDSSLTAEGLAEARDERRAALTKALGARVAQATAHADGALTEADGVAAPHRPVLDPDDVAQLARTDSAWNNRIKPGLDAGQGWEDIIPRLDHDGILAVQRNAEAFESARRNKLTQHEVPGVMAGINHALAERAIEAAAEGAPRDALRLHAEVSRVRDAVAVQEAAITPLLSGAPRGATLVDAQIAVKRAAHAVGAQPSAEGGAAAA